jgi:hypothetical protein
MKEKVTADTITDDQIRELQRSIAGHVFPAAGMAHTELSDLWEVCNVALNSVLFDDVRPRPIDVRDARARCAEIWNARHGGTGGAP